MYVTSEKMRKKAWGQHRRARCPWLGRLLIILAPFLLIVWFLWFGTGNEYRRLSRYTTGFLAVYSIGWVGFELFCYILIKSHPEMGCIPYKSDENSKKWVYLYPFTFKGKVMLYKGPKILLFKTWSLCVSKKNPAFNIEFKNINLY
jgi:hypothetical protein